MSDALEEGGKDIGNVRRVVDGGNKLKEGFWEMQVRTKNQLNRKGRDVISIPFSFFFQHDCSKRDCLKIFNLVHNHFSGVPNGYKKLCSALFDAYNESLSSVATNSTKGSTRDCQILSFPEIHLSPRRSRKRSAGFL